MHYKFYFLGSYLLIVSFFIKSMNSDDLTVFMHLETNIERRVTIARYYVDKKDGLFDINAEMRQDQNIVTLYLHKIPEKDLALNPNPLVDYFFSQGACFAGQYCNYSNKYRCNLFMWALVEKKSLSESLFVSQLCLAAKIKHTDIHNRLLSLMCSFKRINNGLSKEIKTIKVPRPIIKIIINNWLARQDAIVDIVRGLEQPVCYLKMPYLKNFESIFIPLHYVTLKYKEYIQSAENDDLKILNPECWKNDPLELITHSPAQLQKFHQNCVKETK